MLKFISDKSFCILSKYTYIEHEQRDIYIYGFELFYSTLFTLLSIFFLSSICLNNILFAVIFILFFYPIRLFCGGYHCKTYRNCFFLTNIIFILSYFFAKLILSYRIQFILKYNFFLWITMYIIIIYRGFNTGLNLTLSQKRINKKRIIVTLLLEIVFLVFLIHHHILYLIAFMGTVSVTIMLLLTKGEE